jgi:hypothetical protein
VKFFGKLKPGLDCPDQVPKNQTLKQVRSIMGKKIHLWSSALALALLCFSMAAAHAQEDSVWVSSVDPVPPDTSVTVDVRLKSTYAFASFSVPLSFQNDSNLEVRLDSVRWSDWFKDNAADFAGDSVNNVDKFMYVYAVWLFDYLPPGDTTLFTMYFATSEFWDPDVGVKIDTFSWSEPPLTFEFFDTTLWPQSLRVVPGFVPGYLGPGSVSLCGDINGDTKVDLPDVVWLIKYLLQSGTPPQCPPEPYVSCADVNCDEKVDIVDAVYLINYIFRGGPAPCDPNDDGVPDC